MPRSRPHLPLLCLFCSFLLTCFCCRSVRAPLCRELLPTGIAGSLVGDKMVDFAITFANLEHDEPEVHKRIRKLAANQADQLFTINQSSYGPLCHRPLAVSIETKASSGSEDDAKDQLLAWTSAWLTRMRRLLDPRSVGLADKDVIMGKLSFPVIIVQCNLWRLYLVQDTADAVTMYNTVPLGDTHSILGIYKLLASLRRLTDWARGPFWTWFKEDILACSNEDNRRNCDELKAGCPGQRERLLPSYLLRCDGGRCARATEGWGGGCTAEYILPRSSLM